jgi:hypothetical protein
MSDLIRREDALDIAYRRSASNNYFVSAAGADIAHAIRALPAVTVQAQDVAVVAFDKQVSDYVRSIGVKEEKDDECWYE